MQKTRSRSIKSEEKRKIPKPALTKKNQFPNIQKDIFELKQLLLESTVLLNHHKIVRGQHKMSAMSRTLEKGYRRFQFRQAWWKKEYNELRVIQSHQIEIRQQQGDWLKHQMVLHKEDKERFGWTLEPEQQRFFSEYSGILTKERYLIEPWGDPTESNQSASDFEDM